MIDAKVTPEVMETLKAVKIANVERLKANDVLTEIANIKRELGEPDLELESFVSKNKFNIIKTDGVLKKRGL